MRDEQGYTLVELVVTLGILGLVSVAMVGSITLGLRTTDDTHRRMVESTDAQLVARYFVPDVQGAESLSLTKQTCAGADPLLHVEWTDQGSANEVAYVVRSVGGERRLARMRCVDGGAAATTDIAYFVGAEDDPAIACDPGCDDPSRVHLTVTEVSGYTFTVSAARRLTE